jgi:hypothetical protein
VRRQVPCDALHIFTNLSPEQLSSTCSSKQQPAVEACCCQITESGEQRSSRSQFVADMLGGHQVTMQPARHATGRPCIWECKTEQHRSICCSAHLIHRAECHVPNGPLVPPQRRMQHQVGQLPQFDGLVLAACCQQRIVGAECQRIDVLVVCCYCCQRGQRNLLLLLRGTCVDARDIAAGERE